ncbi:hypothetical protein WSS15_03220 [Acetobacter pasteurianus]|nr:hypothetical protein [Acetobacter pasteurianus]ASC05785.1 hypothetical protein S101468_01538 [Acetobacter pasteurianus subsp. pasteurianus]OAZ70611.1 hypothetical protein SRCM100623_02242 [Acetobacter pasteurianus]CCT59445.1 hypothetical protein APA386B_1357 [Acetobacter pasteurianus 386B]GCD53738.1 hypothetical protein NBRC3188_2435 [Acetobacter pasteurianus NBRC 3188]GCD57014.1 hypothetical protein NBRC3222_2351 [Acetobacter pasteurianus NBRC 3222]
MLRKPNTTLNMTHQNTNISTGHKTRDSLSDLQFLQEWVASPAYSTASVLRAGQIRRTNPDLVRQVAAKTHKTP